MEINLVTLQNLFETMPQWMFAVIKAKSGPTTYSNMWLFWRGSKLQMTEYKKNN